MLDKQQCKILKQMVEEQGWTIVDVRTAHEFYHGHLPGAVHCAPEDLARLDSFGKYLLYCRSGARSETAKNFLRMKDIDAINIGGYDQLKECLGSN
jgi:rhodanese-related sulfurtransferase